ISGGLLLVVVALLATLIGMRRALTRNRLHRGDPGQRIAGAWREVTDALRLAGRPAPVDLSATEVAERARHALTDAVDPGATDGAGAGGAPGAGTSADAGRSPGAGGMPPAVAYLAVDDLARLVNQVTFAPGTATAEQAAAATGAATTYTGALRAARPRWRRLLWSAHPGPLRWPR
ncbi:transglutaminase domain-containing protein, partial [Micromonospora sp. NPDC051296]